MSKLLPAGEVTKSTVGYRGDGSPSPHPCRLLPPPFCFISCSQRDSHIPSRIEAAPSSKSLSDAAKKRTGGRACCKTQKKDTLAVFSAQSRLPRPDQRASRHLRSP